MTTEAAEPDSPALRCYRHPDRETWVRCGRCDQPICSRCAMQGPVGFRCRECGQPAYDPLTSMRPAQLAIGFGVAVLGGLVVRLLSTRFGILGLLLAWFAGGIVADAVMRFIGIKRGARMAVTLSGGIVLGSAVAFVTEATFVASGFGTDGGMVLAAYVTSVGPWAALATGIACFGAWSRLRF